MHPPRFHSSHTIADWPECFFEIRCPQCGKGREGPVKMFGPPEARILDVVGKLRCQKCRVLAAPVYLNASYHRERIGGPEPDWSLELVPKPRPFP